MKKYATRKFNGDDSYSWAVFRAADVRGIRSPIFSGQASPVVSGLSRRDASYHKSKLESSTPAPLTDDEKRLREIDQELLELKNARLLKLKSC